LPEWAQSSQATAPVSFVLVNLWLGQALAQVGNSKANIRCCPKMRNQPWRRSRPSQGCNDACDHVCSKEMRFLNSPRRALNHELSAMPTKNLAFFLSPVFSPDPAQFVTAVVRFAT